MSTWQFFFPDTPFKIHVSAINKGPENHVMQFFFSTNMSSPRAEFERKLLCFGCYLCFFLTILRRIKADIFESSVRRRQNRIDNAFICVNLASIDFGRILSTG